MTPDKPDPEYVLGASASERERLAQQADVFNPLTERIFRQAGIQPGMRVLDVGCGAGDVSLLVQRLVEKDGSVLGVDRQAASLETAQSRATRMRIKNISFLESDFRYLDPKHGVFDAVVGRLVLMYQSDPADAVRLVAQKVRPGGVIAFHELAATTGMAHPPLPLREQVARWVTETFRRSGAETLMGIRLYSTFEAAGLHSPQILAEPIVDEPSSPYPWVPMVSVLLPKMVELGVAMEAEVGIDTLAVRLEQEFIDVKGIAVPYISFGAWAVRSGELA